MSRNDAWMPLYGDRLFKSNTWLLANPAARACMLPLWWAAWKEEPAGSLLDDDVVLAQLAGLGTAAKAWLAVRPQALRGWQRREDGRIYHPVVVELKAEAARVGAKSAAKREGDAERLRLWREEQRLKREGNADETRFTPVPETRFERVDNRTEQDKTQKKEPSPSAQGARERLALPDWLPADPWRAFVEMRKKLRKPLTDAAAGLILGKLDGFRLSGHDVAAVLNASVENGWQGVFEPKGTRGNGRSDAGKPGNLSLLLKRHAPAEAEPTRDINHDWEAA